MHLSQNYIDFSPGPLRFSKKGLIENELTVMRFQYHDIFNELSSVLKQIHNLTQNLQTERREFKCFSQTVVVYVVLELNDVDS